MSRKLPKVLDTDEQEALLDQFNTRFWSPRRNRTLVLTGLDAGLRVGELVALKLDHLNLPGRKLTVREGKGAKDRQVPLTERLVEALHGWLEHRTDEVGSESPWVFPTGEGGQLLPRYVRKVIKREARKAGIREAERVSPHTLRHTAATDLLRETGNLELVRQFLGHESVETTQLYTHLVTEDLDQAVVSFRR